MPHEHDVDQHLTVLPECPTSQKPGEPANPGSSETLPLLFIVTITTFPKQLADVWIYVIVLAAVAAAAIGGALWFWD